MFIQNVSYDAIKKGLHFNAGPNSMLIQIVDPDMDFPEPLHEFKKVRKYKFLDSEILECNQSPKIQHAKMIADDLLEAYNNKMHVVVHCVAGLCRSGAVAEAGIRMGFEDAEAIRHPNRLLLSMMLEQLGLNYVPSFEGLEVCE